MHMLKAIWGFILAKLKLNAPVKKAVKRQIAKRIKEADARVREDIDFAQAQFSKKVMEAANALFDDKQAAVHRQVKELVSRLVD